ncbi:MAG TPA: hypothetical protein VLE89_03180, partial [Chlamydiales bacterium]|nr:hypothetical protein [Chlamydiales bacterium]
MVPSAASTRPVLPQFFERKPLQCICLRIVALLRPIFDYFIRIIVFQLGMMKSFGARLIMRTYQRLTSDPREKRPFDLHRLAQSKSLLISCGGTEVSLPTADGKAQVSGLTFTSKGFFQHFFNLGAEIKLVPYDNQLRKVLVPSPRLLQPEYSPMKDRLYHDLHKFKFPLIPVSLPSGTVQAGLLPEEPTFVDGPAFIIHCHSPGRAWPMERSLFRLLCGAGYDGAFWDPRGTEEIKGDIKAGSKGNIKEDGEGGIYLDLRAVYKQARTLGYLPHRIYAFGFCEGAAHAAELYAAFRDLGINFVGANLFDSMHGLVLNHGPIGRIFGPPSIPAL